MCVPPCPYCKELNERGYTQFVRWSDWEWSMQGRLSRGPTAHIMSGFHCVCFAPGGKTLFKREFSLAFLAVPALLPLRRSGSGCAHGNRRWIRWREWRRASPYLLPFPSDPAPALWDPAHLAVLLPGERARCSACPFPRRGTGRMSMSFPKTYVCTSMLWINIKQNKVIERNISGEQSSQNTQLSWERKEGLIMFSPLQFI